MRILFVPLEDLRPESNEHVPGRIRLLARQNKLRGVPRAKPFTRGLGGSLAYIRFFFYGLKVLLYGLGRKDDFDVIFCFENAYTLVGGILGVLLGKPCLRDCAGVTREWISRVRPPKGLAIACLAVEKISRRLASMTIVLSEADKRSYLMDGIENSRIGVLPLTVDVVLAGQIDRSSARARVRQKLGLANKTGLVIFTGGSRDYPPNMQAVRWILEKLAPALDARRCDVHVIITGSGKMPGIHPKITYAGFVPDVLEYLAAADVAIVPLEMGAGMSTKTLDAMVCATPVVAMASIACGIPQLRDGINAMLARDQGELLAKTIYLLEHPEEASRIGTEARKTVETCYDWRAWEGRMQAIVELVASTRPGAQAGEKARSPK